MQHSNPVAAKSWFDAVVGQLRTAREETHSAGRGSRGQKIPSRVTRATIVEQIVSALFPANCGGLGRSEDGVDTYVSSILRHALGELSRQIQLDLSLGSDCADMSPAELAAKANLIVREFAAQLPAIRAMLVCDLLAASEGDPSAAKYHEILLGYPGMFATVHYRLAHALFRLGATLSARLIAGIAHSKTAIDIHPGAEIGSHFFINHGTGVVVGETTVIRNRVKLHQGVTLGAYDSPTDERGLAVSGGLHHPIVEDDVVIYAGATILGRVTIGRGSVIGGNVWLTQSVPAGSRIAQAHMRSG